MFTQQTEEIKVVFIGDSGVGKTSLFQCLQGVDLQKDLTPTIGGSHVNISLDGEKGKIECNVWDTAGQEKFRTLVPMYFQSAHFVLLVFDVTSRDSFESIDQWMEIVREKAPTNVKIIILGNKVDLLKETKEHVQLSELEEVGKRYNSVLSIQVSAVKGEGINLIKSSIYNEYFKIGEEQQQQIKNETNLNLNSKQSQPCC